MNQLELVVNPYGNASSPNRQGAFVKGEWSLANQEFIERNEVKALYFNSSMGWKGNDFSFLDSLSTIEEIDIICSEITNLASIEKITSLKELSINGVVDGNVDFSAFNQLEKCYLYWWDGALTIFNSHTIKELYLDGIPHLPEARYSFSQTLKHLTIANSKVESLSIVNEFSELEELALHNCKKINNFSFLKRCENLRRLEITGNRKLKNLKEFSKLIHLEILILSNCFKIDSLEGIRALKSLKAFAFDGNTNILDGDLSLLLSLPTLSMLMFGSRKHYNYKLIKNWSWDNLNTPDILLKRIDQP